MRTKAFTQLSGNEDGQTWDIKLSINEDAGFHKKGGAFDFRNPKERKGKDKYKSRIRNLDARWVANNIPSSIVWVTQNHHDWENGGILYLLTKGEHILRHRREK